MYREGESVEVKRLVWAWPLRRHWRAATIAFQLTRDRYGVTMRTGPRSVFNVGNIRKEINSAAIYNAYGP
jgi:hypothetical protein